MAFVFSKTDSTAMETAVVTDSDFTVGSSEKKHLSAQTQLLSYVVLFSKMCLTVIDTSSP